MINHQQDLLTATTSEQIPQEEETTLFLPVIDLTKAFTLSAEEV